MSDNQRILKKLPKNETIVETYNDTINNKIYIVTENWQQLKRYKLYLKNNNEYVFLKSKQDPLFKETHPTIKEK